MDKSSPNKKTAKTQFEIYLDYVKKYSVLKLNWIVQKKYSSELGNIWRDMTGRLNEGGGPIRDVTHWKKVFTEWKSHTRRKLKYNKPLNDIEKQLIELTGLTGTPERKRKHQEKELGAVKSAGLKSYAKENLAKSRPIKKIKEEIMDDSSSSFSTVEGETKPVGGQNLHAKDNSKVLQRNQKENHNTLQSQDEADDSIEDTFNETANSSNSIRNFSYAIMALTRAVNRYCDIAEKKQI